MSLPTSETNSSDEQSDRRVTSEHGQGSRDVGDRHVLIVGSGVVGFATGVGLKQRGFKVKFYDTDPTRLHRLSTNGYEIAHLPEPSDIYVVCVPSKDLELKSVREAARAIGEVLRPNDLCILRSTVPPGSTRTIFIPTLEDASHLKAGTDFRVTYEPEFLRAEDDNDPVADELNPHVVLVGEAIPETATVLDEVYSRNESSKVVITDYETAEYAKLLHNTFNAAKISFFNEAWAIAKELGIDGNFVNEIVSRSAEGSWNEEYGIVGGTPYGGQCLPKDVSLLLKFCTEKKLDSPLLAAVQKVNQSLGGE